MPKGLSTASAVILFERAPALDAVAGALRRAHEVVRTDDTRAPDATWIGGVPFALVAYRPEVNGLVVAELRDTRWPDGMGDSSDEPELFGAWTMGFFGPFVFPGALERAAALPVLCPDAAPAAERHGAFVILRASYAFGAGDEDPVLPADYDALHELRFITAAARAVLDVPGALAYFNPNGEVLCNAATFDDYLAFQTRHGQVPLDLWCNVRLIRRAEDADWAAMDTLGMEQLGVEDVEACFPAKTYAPNEVSAWLRNISHYLLANGPVIQPGDTTTGPGNVAWHARPANEPLLPAIRPTLRWFPAGAKPPAWTLEGIADS